MGVKHLWDVLESCKKTLPLHHLRNKRVCVDLSCWIVQLHNVSKSHNAIKEKVYLQGLFHRLRALIALNCTLIFVADGSIPSIKLSTYRRRLNSGHEVVQDDTNPQNQCSLRRNMGSEFSCMIKEAKLLGLALGVPCLDGIEEAEAQCALLNSESLCDGCFTSDSDVFLFGARTVYRDISLGEGGHVICYEMEDIERKLGFGRNSLITLALLLGGDYSHGVHGLGPESACQIVRTFGEKSVLQQIVSEGLPIVKKTKKSKKQMQIQKESEIDTNGNDINLQRQKQFLLVIEAYLKPKCHSADSDEVFRVLAQHPFQRTKFQQICAQFFGWSPEKTDEYILPKVAERNLQRFANLRLVSAGVGVKPPIDKMPVKCPVAEIVKQRKVQGRECFEVLWEGFDGLKTSVVTAALVESACPEKIAEFEEKKAMGKKQNNRKQRPKKSENRSAMAELDLKLQNLLLDIESESDHARNITSPSRTVVSEDRIRTTMVDSMKQVPFFYHQNAGTSGYDPISPSRTVVSVDRITTTMVELDCMKQVPFFAESKINHHQNAGTSGYCVPVTSMAKHEVIDLSTPSPMVRTRTVTGCQRVNTQQHVDVIDLCESENEVSPEHMRKAKELRLFLANIKDDIL